MIAFQKQTTHFIGNGCFSPPGDALFGFVFYAKAGTVQHISPDVQNAALTIQNGLVAVEAVQVEGHGADAHGREPDASNRPGAKEEVKAMAVDERGILEDQATE